MKLWYIGIGILFLMNPVLGVSDLMPDFIGCFLITLGIRDAAFMIEKFSSSKKYFTYAALLSLGRFAVSFMGIERQHTLPLVVAFVLAIGEMLLYIPAIRDLFAGFDYAAMRHGGSKILSHGVKEGLYYDENGLRQYGTVQEDTNGKIARSMTVFIVIRAIMSVVPELPALQLSESENLGDVGSFSFASIGTLISAVCFVIVIIPATVAFVRCALFLRRVGKAEGFIPSVYKELGERFGDLGELYTASRMKLLSLFGGAAVLLYMGFYDYQINVIPRYVSAAVLALSVSLLLAESRKVRCLVPILLAAGAVPLSIRTFALQKEHYSLYREQMMALFESGETFIPDRNINIMDAEYLRMAYVETAEAVVLGAGIILFLVFYMMLCLKHTRELASVPERDRIPLKKSLIIRGAFMILGAVGCTVYFAAYRFILPSFDQAQLVGVAVCIAATALFAIFATQANKYVYGNNYEI